MSKHPGRRPGLLALATARGAEQRCLRVGAWEIALHGLDPELAGDLDRRWGGFCAPRCRQEPRLSLRVFEDERGLCPGNWRGGQPYAIRGEVEGGLPLGVLHHVVLAPEDAESAVWRAAMARTPDEPPGRTFENAVRYLLARLVTREGGLALHGAGVLRQGRAWIFAGPPGSGKTTAVDLSRPATSLGDDFAVLVPGPEGWRTAAVPFDNREEAPSEAPPGLLPVAGVWRLYHAPEPRVERLAGVRAAASLMTCAAFPWALADLGAEILDHARRYVSEAVYGHLSFRPAPDFWPLLEGED
jgi:hypothetical protein